MTSYVTAGVRREVGRRAAGACEYCLIHEDDTFVGCHVDHIIAEKHGGITDLNNLAFACAYCNRAKGTDIASLIPGTRTLVRLYNPRTDRWSEHFRFEPNSCSIVPLTEIGRVTAHLFGFNRIERVLERQALARIGHFPP